MSRKAHSPTLSLHSRFARITIVNQRQDRSTPSIEVTAQTESKVYRVDPLEDPRWNEFLQRHPKASIFHTTEWVKALRDAYGYEPTVLTTSPPHAVLQNGLIVCRVESWLTGRRLVSVPFSDHCEPLIEDTADRTAIFSAVEQQVRQEKLLYMEFRPITGLELNTSLFRSNQAYCLHQLDLRHDLETLFKNCHKDSTQRKIRRAAREGLSYEEGHSESLLTSFYHLFLLTRYRHQAPPPPKKWFRSLIGCFGEALKIRIAFKHSQPVAAILTLRYKDTLVYKYGGSDARFNNLGGTHLLLWQSIQEAKQQALRVFDLGRTDGNNSGLIRFKDRWGSTRPELIYSRFTASKESKENYRPTHDDWRLLVAKRLFARMPNRTLALAGSLLYKHVG